MDVSDAGSQFQVQTECLMHCVTARHSIEAKARVSRHTAYVQARFVLPLGE